MGHKDGLADGEITHGICDACMVAMFPVPHLDIGLILECKQSGIAPHALAQITNGYFTAYDGYQVSTGSDAVAFSAIWVKCHNKLSAIRKAARRAKRARTRRYVR
jgi:hypothetical protein